MPQPRAVANNRKLPVLPLSIAQLGHDDRRRWAVLFTNARLRKRWTYTTLSVISGVSLCATVQACTRGIANSCTVLRLLNALDLALPQSVPIATGYEAEHGHQRVVQLPAHEAVDR